MKQNFLTRWYLICLWFFRKWLSIFNHCFLFYPLRVEGSYFSEHHQDEVISLKISGWRSFIRLTLSECLSNRCYLANLHPFDLSVLALLLRAKGSVCAEQLHFPLHEVVKLTSFRYIAHQFYSEHAQQEMLVVAVPETDAYFCLSVRQFLDDPSLYALVREASVESEADICFMNEQDEYAILLSQAHNH